MRDWIEFKVFFMSGITTRDQIVEAADQLFYRQGYAHTSFADIAGAVKIPRGNVCYHFKSKHDIVDSVIGASLTKTRELPVRWEAEEKTLTIVFGVIFNSSSRIEILFNITAVGRHAVHRACEAGSWLTRKGQRGIYAVSNLATRTIHPAWL